MLLYYTALPQMKKVGNTLPRKGGVKQKRFKKTPKS